jgi:tetratricopeptide (TPR) repeat protein
LLSKRAAVAIISQEPQPSDDAWPALTETILKSLDRSKRPAADWLRTYVIDRGNTEQATQQWAEHINAERRTLQERPQQSHHTLVLDLMRHQVELLERLNRPEEALAVMRKMVATERGDSESLSALVGWFAKRKGWTAVDELAARFARTFDSDPLLLYTLAEARTVQGKSEDAEEAVARALKLTGEKGGDHITIARQLQERGLIRWAEREYQYLISTTSETLQGLYARLKLSEIYHDRLDEKSAAEMIEAALAIMKKDKNLSARIQQYWELHELKARMHYYLAKHYEAQKDDAQMHKELQAAIAADETDADVLIAMYRLPDASPEYREKTKERIKSAANVFRKAIEADPDDPSPYNQLAWLIGNTEGDFDEAIRLSQRSVDLSRASDEPSGRLRVPGYLDTLAHCYYAKKDYENAVRNQAEANRLEPQSLAIKRQLEVFQQALAEQKGSK